MPSLIKLDSGVVSYGTDGLVMQLSSRAPVRMVQEVGYAMISGNVRTLLTGDTATTNRRAQIEMGCLNEGFSLKVEFESDDLPLSCNTAGTKKIHKSGKWTGSIGTKQIDPVIMALRTGGTLKDVSATNPLIIITTEELTASASVVTLPGTPTFPDREILISVKRTSDNELYHEVETGGTPAVPTATTPGTFIFDKTAGTLTFAAGDATSEFEIIYRELDTTAGSGLIIAPSLSNFPGTFDGWMSFLAIAQNDNAVGRIIAEFEKASFDEGFTLGGKGVREHLTDEMAFTLEEAPTIYWEEFATT